MGKGKAWLPIAAGTLVGFGAGVAVGHYVLSGYLPGAAAARDPTTPSRSNFQQVEKLDEQIRKVLKVKVTANGDITADGKPVTLEQMAAMLSELKRASGKVWYYRETPGGEPHPNGIKVIKLMFDNRLPIWLSMKSDFSDAVDDHGVSRPSGK